jgi:hypothetical protein
MAPRPCWLHSNPVLNFCRRGAKEVQLFWVYHKIRRLISLIKSALLDGNRLISVVFFKACCFIKNRTDSPCCDGFVPFDVDEGGAPSGRHWFLRACLNYDFL